MLLKVLIYNLLNNIFQATGNFAETVPLFIFDYWKQFHTIYIHTIDWKGFFGHCHIQTHKPKAFAL